MSTPEVPLTHCVFCGKRFVKGDEVLRWDLGKGRPTLSYHANKPACAGAAKTAEAQDFRIYLVADPVD